MILPEIAVLRETVLDRSLPSFDDVSAEAERASDEALEKLGRSFDPEHDDPADAYEQALDAGIMYYEQRTSARQAVLNLFAVALRHLHEQKLIFLLRRELLPKEEENNLKLIAKPGVVEAAFKQQGLDLEGFQDWPTVNELRLVANVAKHADGNSAKELWELRKDLFTPPVLKGDPDSPLNSFRGQVMSPMTGEDLYVTPEDLASYFDGVERFWRELAEAMAALAAAE